MQSVVEANNKFTLDLYQVLQKDDKFTDQNIFYSPSSISIALAMTFMGARGDTAKQMSEALHWEAMTSDQLHDQQRHFLDALQESNDEGNELLAANRLFVQKSFTVEQEFLEGTKRFYNAEMALTDYQKDPEGARKEINDWVENKTKENIKNLIPEGIIDSGTELTLVNAIYFKGIWQNEFDQRATRSKDFFVSKKKKVKVKMMKLKTNFKHIANVGELGCQLLELPYQGEDLSMLILLPQDKYGLTSVEDSLTHDKLQKAIALTQVQPSGEVKVYLPRFNMTQEFQLKKLLAKMGVTDMFNANKADFTGISPGLFVTHAIHKAFVEVNEKGTEAAAATAVLMSRSKSPPGGSAKIPVFCADHPFLFLLCHKKSGGILFMGRMMKPEPLD